MNEQEARLAQFQASLDQAQAIARNCIASISPETQIELGNNLSSGENFRAWCENQPDGFRIAWGFALLGFATAFEAHHRRIAESDHD